jgi:hypothetical protein
MGRNMTDLARRNVEAIYDDIDDLFPWTWQPWVTSEGDRREVGAISSPNGRRPDGTMHTYWSITGEVWEPHGHLICEAVNAWVKPGWRARLGRWLLGGRL